MLEYDNSAFYYFMLTTLTIYLLPATYSIVNHTWSALFPKLDAREEARTSLEQKKAVKIKEERSASKKLFKTSFCAFAFFTIAMWLLFWFLVRLVSNDTEIMSFDPYKILEIERGVEDAEIKSAYRKLSLKVRRARRGRPPLAARAGPLTNLSCRVRSPRFAVPSGQKSGQQTRRGDVHQSGQRV